MARQLLDFCAAMGFWDFISIRAKAKPAREARAATVSPEQGWVDFLSNYGLKGPMDVTVAKALTISAVYACIRIRATSIASLHLGLYKKVKGGWEEVFEGNEWEKVCLEPSPLYSSFSWRMANQMQKDLNGESFNRLYFDGLDKPTAGRINKIELIRGHVTPKIKGDNLYYDVTYIDGRQETLLDYEVLHLQGLTENGLRGIAPIEAAKQTLSAALAADEYGLDVWESGGVLKGFLEAPHILTTAQKNDLRQSIIDVMRNYSESSGIGVLQNGIKFNKVGISPAETQLLEYKKFINAEVSRYYGVPLHMISDLERATFSNIEHQGIEFSM